MDYDTLLKNYTDFYNLHNEKIKLACECISANPSSKLLDVVKSLRENGLASLDNLEWDDHVSKIFQDAITVCKENLEQTEINIHDNFEKSEETYKEINTNLENLKAIVDIFGDRIGNKPNSDNYITKSYNKETKKIESKISSSYYTDEKTWTNDCQNFNDQCDELQQSIELMLGTLSEINGESLNIEKANLTGILETGKGVYLGKYGVYYSSPPGETYHLNQEQMRANATYIYKYLSDKGWSKNAIIGVIANMQAESSLNPNRYEGDRVRDFSLNKGYGLVQWTPPSKFVNWALENGYTKDECATLDVQLERIIYEFEKGIQYYPNSYSKYITATNFKTSQLSSAELAQAFVYNYERPAEVAKQARLRAQYTTGWEEFFKSSVIGV